MHPLALLNTSIITTDGNYNLKTIDLEQATRLCIAYNGNILSAIGHQTTADILSALLPISVSVNRIQFKQEPGQLALVFKLRGRPPEGKILTREEMEEIGYDFQVLTRLLDSCNELIFYYFWRGNTVYWNESKHVVMICLNAALDATSRGYPTPGELMETTMHPSRIGYAWRLFDENESMG